MRQPAIPPTETIAFGALLKQMRRRAGMTQRDLAAALDYSDSQISSLEQAQRLPNLEAVITRFVPALGLQDDPASAALLIETAAAARGERPPASVTLQRTRHVVVEAGAGRAHRNGCRCRRRHCLAVTRKSTSCAIACWGTAGGC